MLIKSAKFTCSYAKVEACPNDERPEFAFIGRSNVGKSSLINMLTAEKKLAKISGTPGKTQLLNYFEINEKWYIVDLPGYGYARTSKTLRAGFSKMIKSYFGDRKALTLAFVLIDSNIPTRDIDIDFVNFLGERGVPFALLFTKIDRKSQHVVAKNVKDFFEEMSKTWETLPMHFLTSAEKRTGREDVLKYISQTLQEIRNSK
jgi:GTP-binding protein